MPNRRLLAGLAVASALLLVSCKQRSPAWGFRFQGEREGIWQQVHSCTCRLTTESFEGDNQSGNPPATRVDCNFGTGEPLGIVGMYGWPGEERTFLGSYVNAGPGTKFSGCGATATAARFDAPTSFPQGASSGVWVHFDALRICGDLATDVKAECFASPTGGL